jgi:hypothetical protein
MFAESKLFVALLPKHVKGLLTLQRKVIWTRALFD